jgi:TPR repeat protein
LSTDQGDASGQFAYGACLEHGRGISLDLVEAGRYYKLSADQGDASGQYAYGLCLELGIGIGIDVSKAARYFKLSGDGDCPLGALKWADCLEYGKGVKADACEAGRYYKKFIECADRKNEYYWDDLEEIMVCDAMTLEVSSRAESIAALFCYAPEHWKSCVTGG